MPTLTTISPTTSKPISEFESVSTESLETVILPKAVAAHKAWAKTPLAKRKQILAKFIDLLGATETIDRLGPVLTEEMGRPIRYVAGEFNTACLRAKTMLDYADAQLAPVAVDPTGPANLKRYLTKEPLGVVLIIYPWNYPYLTSVNSVVPALLAGNAILFKPSPQVPRTAEAFVDLLTRAGLPEGVFQAVHCGDNDVISALISRESAPAIDGVIFTGSVAGGLAVQKAAAGRTIPVTLELGGNDAAYVRNDVKDLKAVAEDIADGAFFNSGQSCCSIERVYVHTDVYEEFVAQAVAVTETYKVGDPSDPDTMMGPLISEKSARNVKSHIDDAVRRGARKLIGGHVFAAAEKLNPSFVGPQVLVDLDEASLTVREETFGPVMPIMRVSSDAEAVAKINDSQYGLTCSVWTSDLEAGEALGNDIEAGTVFVNRADYPDPHLAWTGYKYSGRGVSLSQFGFGGVTKLKSHHIKSV